MPAGVGTGGSGIRALAHARRLAFLDSLLCLVNAVDGAPILWQRRMGPTPEYPIHQPGGGADSGRMKMTMMRVRCELHHSGGSRRPSTSGYGQSSVSSAGGVSEPQVCAKAEVGVCALVD